MKAILEYSYEGEKPTLVALEVNEVMYDAKIDELCVFCHSDANNGYYSFVGLGESIATRVVEEMYRTGSADLRQYKPYCKGFFDDDEEDSEVYESPQDGDDSSMDDGGEDHGFFTLGKESKTGKRGFVLNGERRSCAFGINNDAN